MKDFLSTAERLTLHERHRRETNRRVGDRIKAVLLSDKGWTNRKISEALLIDEQTIGTHVDEYRDSQKLTLSCKRGLQANLMRLKRLHWLRIFNPQPTSKSKRFVPMF